MHPLPIDQRLTSLMFSLRAAGGRTVSMSGLWKVTPHATTAALAR